MPYGVRSADTCMVTSGWMIMPACVVTWTVAGAAAVPQSVRAVQSFGVVDDDDDGAHAVHAVAPGSDHVFAPHGVHALEPIALVNWLLGHERHALVPGAGA
jgi:hypothetical protein